jgi:hypothetical protein
MLAIEAASVVDGDVDGNGNLILTKKDGTQINAGPVIGPPGPQGPIGSDLSVISARPVLDVGIINQIRAGRQLSAADFANIGLSAPVGLWNLSDLNDVSGNGRNLLNKGAVPFAAGITGDPNTAAQFAGLTTQALYISDTGAADPFRIKTGSWGAWFRTASRTNQFIITKRSTSSLYAFTLNASGTLLGGITIDGVNFVTPTGMTDVCDNRWHFGVITFDGDLVRLYCDGTLEGTVSVHGTIFQSTAPLNIGAGAADASTIANLPFFGRIDEAFITADVLIEDQIRNLYCTKISHTLGAIPTRASLNVRRRRRGAALVVADFPTPPLRLHNFSAGSLADEGSGNVPLVNNGGAVNIAGVDGSAGNAMAFNGTSQYLSSSDTGLPIGTATRSYGAWFKTLQGAAGATNSIIALGNGEILWAGSATAPGCIGHSNVTDAINTQCYVTDGQWHFAVMVIDNAAPDGLKRKLYCDGKLIATSATLLAIAAVGASGFRVGIWTSATGYMMGSIDGVFICDYVLTPEQILALYAKGSQTLARSPKNAGDHVEAMSANDILAIFDTLESQHQVNLAVA